ncbi:MAG TPA: glycoside hydrolase family 3 C-terminal domain-containing protein [Actinospica sp.]|jgi:beta-glucosidase|nr:glycoside hydrolase family 3 C-terminal domain-containing protein [Actinospica sp.]
MATSQHIEQPSDDVFGAQVEAVRAGRASARDAAALLVARLADDELLWLLDGDVSVRKGAPEMGKRYNAVPIEAGRLERWGIPGIRFTDGPRGIAVGNSTAFPVSIARAAAFDTELERRIGAAVGAEGRAAGANLFAGVCVNVPPFPGWGRSQESYGEDPVLTGAMGAALARGVEPWMMTCVKHFALNSMEEARFTVDVHVAEDVLHEVYLPHFRTVVEAGVDSVMTSYNAVNGEWAGDNRPLMTGVLRETWGFDGFTMTDFVFGLRKPIESVGAGQDLEMPFRQQRAATLPRALRSGQLDRADVEAAAIRILATQLRYAVRAQPDPEPDIVACDAHRELAYEAAVRGSVLLRNEPVGDAPLLPLDVAAPGKVLVCGALADQPNLGDNGSSRVRPPSTVTILDGLRTRLGDRLVHIDGGTDEAASAARDVAAAIVVAGLGAEDEGEAVSGLDVDTLTLLGGPLKWRPVAAALARIGARKARNAGFTGGDRRDLHLKPEDVALIEAVSAANQHTIVILVGGGTIMTDPWDQHVAAILLAWYPGLEGGRAVADIVFGDVEPGGRLPVAVPRRREDLPVVDWNARRVNYPRWFGQRKLDRDGVAAAYPFGHGLGYTSFRIDSISVETGDDETFTATVGVTNTGHRRGRHVVQLYATQSQNPELPGRVLAGFSPIELDAGQSGSITIEGTLRSLQTWADHGFTTAVEAAAVTIEAASYSGDSHAITARIPQH